VLVWSHIKVVLLQSSDTKQRKYQALFHCLQMSLLDSKLLDSLCQGLGSDAALDEEHLRQCEVLMSSKEVSNMSCTSVNAVPCFKYGSIELYILQHHRHKEVISFCSVCCCLRTFASYILMQLVHMLHIQNPINIPS